MHARSVILALLLLLAGCGRGNSPSPDAAAEAGTQMPDTPAGQKAALLLEALRSGDGAAHRAFIEEHLDPGLVDQFPMETHLAMFEEAAAAISPAELMGVEASGSDEVGLLLRMEDGSRERLVVSVASDPPHPVVGLRIVEEASRSGAVQAASFEELNRELERMAAEESFSGVVHAVRADRVVFHEAYGLADREAGRAVGPGTRFDIGSLDKLFTSVAILALVEEGSVGLDRPVPEYVDALDPDLSRRITIRQLLQHRSGLGDYLNHPEFRADPKRFRTVDDFMELVRGGDLEFEPGARARYSNSGFVVLGAVIESVTGRPYHDVVRSRVLEPAGMSSTGPRPDARSAFRYSHEEGELIRTDARWPDVGSPAGGGYSTAEDLHRFLEALLDDRLLSPRQTNLLLRNFEGSGEEPFDRTAVRIGWGGGAPGLNAELAFDGATDRIVAVVANRDPPVAAQIGRAMLQMDW